MTPMTLIRLARTGTNTDLIRTVLTGFAAAVATLLCLCAATVAAIGGDPDGRAVRYTSGLLIEPGWRTTLVVTMIALTLPFVVFAAQCTRLGAPVRDRRIAVYRLVGATPRQAVIVATSETALAGLAGSLAGLAGWLVLRWSLPGPATDDPNAFGAAAWPTDVVPPWLVIALICVGLPVAGTLLTAVLLRRVRLSPLGVARLVRRRRPHGLLPITLIGIGAASVLSPIYTRGHPTNPILLLVAVYGGALVVFGGLVLCTGWIAYTAGRLTRRFSRSPAGLIAAARMTADPWSFSRTLGFMIVAAAIGGIACNSYAETIAMARLAAIPGSRLGLGDSWAFLARVYAGVGAVLAVTIVVAAFTLMVSIVETITSQRRAYASLVAGGVPRAVLARATLRQSMSVAMPSVVLATIVGYLVVRMLFDSSGEPQTPGTGGRILTVVRPVPWPELSLIIGGTLLAIVVTGLIGAAFLRTATHVDELRTA